MTSSYQHVSCAEEAILLWCRKSLQVIKTFGYIQNNCIITKINYPENVQQFHKGPSSFGKNESSSVRYGVACIYVLLNVSVETLHFVRTKRSQLEVPVECLVYVCLWSFVWEESHWTISTSENKTLKCWTLIGIHYFK